MNKRNIFFIALLAIVIIFSTLFVSVKKPYLHKQVLITDSGYTFVEEDLSASKPVKVSIQNIQPTQAQKVKLSNKTEQTSSPKIKVNQPKPKPAVKKQAQVKTVKTKTPVTKPVTPKPAAPVPVQKNTPAQNKPAQSVQKNVLTEKEEIIAWNHWRSELQNQVMRDTKIGAPLGTQFKFSFTVDKFGNISNIKVWSQNPVYTDLGVRVIKPVLMSYQNKPILNFPEGTKRIITNVTGGFYISTSTKYSTPKDYSDYEKVKRIK